MANPTMRSKQLRLDNYDTDKITHHYLEWYNPILEPWLDKEIKLLEIGIYKGGSLLLWRDYFPLGIIVGIDLKLPDDFVPGDRIQIFEGSQADGPFLSEVANHTAPEGFDIIIDDASHLGELTKTTFWHLFDNHLKPGGLYVIEDWGTGYWDDWPDGKGLNLSKPIVSRVRSVLPPWLSSRMKTPFPCHSYGMVGFIKELIDEQAAANISRRRWTGKASKASKFEHVLITPHIVFVKKADAQP
jgi:hypothetical protein